MSSVVHPIETESLADLPPGAAPSFGDLETGTASDSAPLVLSEAAHRTISGSGPLDMLSGTFHLDDSLFDGELLVEPAGTPGLVHVHADISHPRGGGLHYDADVRESWLLRESADLDPDDSRARVARAIAELASLPHQSTVKVSFES